MKDSWPAAARCLAAGGSQTDAARAAKVDPRTVRRWLDNEAQFADRVDDARTEMLTQAAGILAKAAGVAADRLAEIAEDGADRHALVASRTILEAASRYRSDLQIEQRLRQLEIASRIRTPVWDE